MIRFTRTILLFTFISFICAGLCAQEWKRTHKSLLDTAIVSARSNAGFAIEQVNKAYEMAVSHEDHWRASNALSTMGYISNVNRDYSTAHTNYTSALKELKKADTVDYFNELAIHQNLALIYRKYKSFDEAIFHYNKAQESLALYKHHQESIYNAKGHKKYLVDIPYSLGLAYRDNGQYKKAGEVFKDLWEKSEYKRDTINLAKVLVQLGLIQQKAKSYDDAEFYFGLVVSAEGVSESLRGIAYHNIGSIYLERELLSEASKYYSHALQIKEKSGSQRSKFITLLDLGEIAFKQGKTKEAIDLWEIGLETYSKVKGEPELFVVYNWLQLAYMDVDISKAKEYNLLYASMNDTWLDNQSKQKEKYSELFALQSEIDKIKSDMEQRAYLTQLLKTYWPFLIGVILTVLLLVYQLNKLISARRKEKLIAKGQKVLDDIEV